MKNQMLASEEILKKVNFCVLKEPAKDYFCQNGSAPGRFVLFEKQIIHAWRPCSDFTHRQPKLNIRETLNYKDLYGNTMDLREMVENNSVLSIKSTYLVSSCIFFVIYQLFKPIRRVSVIRVSTVKCNERPNSISAMPEA